MEKNKNFTNLKNLINYSDGGIFSKILFKGQNNQLTLFCMAKDTDIGEHTSTKEGYVHVLEGEGTFNLEGENILMKKGVIIHMSRNAKHSLLASNNLSFLLMLTN